MEGHIAHADEAANAVMSQHVAQKCMGERACAVMSEHLAQQSVCTSFSNSIGCRYL